MQTDDLIIAVINLTTRNWTLPGHTCGIRTLQIPHASSAVHVKPSSTSCFQRSPQMRGGGIFVHTWSHQHSEKLGNWCSRLYSRNSNMTLIIIHIHQSRIISVWGGGEHKERVSRRTRASVEWEEVGKTPQEEMLIMHRCKCYRKDADAVTSVVITSRLRTPDVSR